MLDDNAAELIKLLHAATAAGAYDPETGTWTGGGGGAPQRWFWFGAVLGPADPEDPNHFVAGFGIDATVPVPPAATPERSAVAQVVLSSIGYSPAGTMAFAPFEIALIGGRGADVVTPEPIALVWELGGAVNWAHLKIKTHDLTADTPRYGYVPGDIEIDHQSGEDFSLGEEDGNPVVLSAAGGQFQAAVYLESSAELDE